MKNLFYALTFFSFVTACSDNSVQNPTPPPVSDNGDNNNMQVVEFLRNRAMVASYNTIFPNKETERIERKGVLLSWRWLSTDPDDIGFDIYRKEGNYKFQKLNKTPIINSSNYKDLTANINKILKYEVRQANTNNILCSCNFTPEMAQNFYRTVPLNNNNLPYPDLVYKASDAAIGDLDGDGDYELVLKREVSPLDNGSTGIGITPGSCLLEAYKLTTGTFLWRIDLGSNIRQGIHYTPFIVYDLNGDGKAEIAVRTSEGTVFGDGTKIGDVNQDGITDYVDRAPQSATYGRIITGPEFLSIIEGRTGKEVARTDYIYRGEKNKWVTYWGDNWANRMDRFLMGVGHFRSQKGIPSLLMCRGYYKNYQIVAFGLFLCKGKSYCRRRLRVPFDCACRRHYACCFLFAEQNHTARCAVRLCSGAAAVSPPEALGCDCPQYAGQNDFCTRQSGDGCHPCRRSHLALPEYHGEWAYTPVRHGSPLGAAWRTHGTFGRNSYGISAWDSCE